MSDLKDRVQDLPPQAAIARDALDRVLFELVDHMKPKAREKARRELESYCGWLETWQGRHLPANVTPLRSRMCEDEAQRESRAQQAFAIRQIIGRAF